jgi:hypothetical protein
MHVPSFAADESLVDLYGAIMSASEFSASIFIVFLIEADFMQF